MKMNVYVCTCLYTYLYVSKCDLRCAILWTNKPSLFHPGNPEVHKTYIRYHPPHSTQTPKFTKHTWREQVHRVVNIPRHPTQTPKFTNHTWREQVHRDVNIPPTPPKPRSSRSIHDVSKFTVTLTSPPPHPNPEVHEAYMTWASSQRDFNIPPTPTPKFTKYTWREQVHRDVNIPPPHPNPKVSRSIHDVTGTVTSSTPPQTLKKTKKRFRYQLPGGGVGN